MAVAPSHGRLEPLRQWRDRETSPERTKVWKEPKPRKVPVVYYLSRNGHLEHPHFMEVTLSSLEGLYLRDVTGRLNYLRGKGMADLYSWSSKRCYKNGFVWHDLAEDDLIHPAHGYEYVLKGSELVQPISSPTSEDSNAAFYASQKPLNLSKSVHDDFDNLQIRKKRVPWSSFDLNEYKVYRNDLKAETGARAADASTQTDDGRSRRRLATIRKVDDRAAIPHPAVADPLTNELERDDISPPPSSSSTETLETLIKAEGGCTEAVPARPEQQEQTAASYANGRMRASSVLMHLLSCGSINVKEQHGLSVSPSPPTQPRQCKERMVARGASDLGGAKITDGLLDCSSFSAVRVEDKEYFSGSLIETKQNAGDGRAEFPGLKRSSSYNADRNSKLELVEKESEGVRAKCIPRMHKATERRETNAPISRSTHGSKRINNEPPRGIVFDSS